jgi:hypothetical protein
VVAGIYSPRFKVENKALMSLAVVAVNHPTNEVFLNITNLQWPLALLLLTVSLREQPEAQYGSVPLQILSDVAIILGCGLTGPFVIFIAPFFLWKWFRNRSRYNLAILLVVIAVAAIQTFFLASHPSRTSAEVATRYTLDPYARIVGQKFFGSLFFGVRHSYSTRPLISCGLLLATLSFIAWRLRNSTAWKTRAAAVFLTFATGVLLATMTAVTSDLLVLAPPDSAPRYVYLPSVLLLWSLIVCIDHAGIRRNAVVLSLLVLAAVSSWTSGFRSKALVDYAWKAHSSSIGKAESAVIPINPPGWFLRIPKKEF